MLINPHTAEGRQLLRPIPGTRIVEETLGIVGASFVDMNNLSRRWTVQALYSPISGRSLGGLRAKVVDQKGFISFCNQRDLEVFLSIASPGGYCPWLDQEYVAPGDGEWFGLCVDEEDLADDLYDRELEARAASDGNPLPEGLSFSRLVHDGPGNDYKEHFVLLWDMDPRTGLMPDTRFETVTLRWRSVERTATHLRGKLWLRT